MLIEAPIRRRVRPITNGRIARLDPSRTLTLRRQWERDLSRRFDRLRREILDLVVEEDALGLRERSLLVLHSNDEPGRWITVKGNHIFIPEGKNAGEVISQHFEQREGRKLKKPTHQRHPAEVADISLPNDNDKYEYFYHSPRSDEELSKITQGGIDLGTSGKIWLSKDEVRDRGAGFVIVRIPRGQAKEGVDRVEPGLVYREWVIKSKVPPEDIIDSRRMVIDKTGFRIREDELAKSFLSGQVSTKELMDLPEQYHRWQASNPVENTRWKFHTSEQKVTAFLAWLKRKVVEHLVGEHLDEHAWWRRYILHGFQRGAARAFDDVRPEAKEAMSWSKPVGWYQGTREEFLRSAFYHPVSKEKVELLASRTFTDLKGVTDSMASRISHALVDGITRGENPRVIGRELAKQVNVSKSRAQTIARTEIIRTHAEGQLDAMERMGMTDVGVMVEWSTSGRGISVKGNPSPCKLCKPLEGAVMTIEEARGLLPRHPNCTCAFIPANVGEKKPKQQRSKVSLEKAIDASYRAEMPKRKKRTLDEQKKMSPWGGADKDISKVRPKGVFNADVENKRKSFFADCERDEQGRCLPGSGTALKEKKGKKSDKVQQHEHKFLWAQRLAIAKAKALPEISEEEVAKANERMDELGADKYESQIRGNTYNRASSRLRLLKEFGDGKHCPCVYCGATLDANTVTRDKIRTAREGGRYKQENLVPACLACNQSRGDTAWEDIKWAGRRKKVQNAEDRSSGRWVTIRGTAVFVDDKGKIKKGPKDLVDSPIDDISKTGKSKLLADAKSVASEHARLALKYAEHLRQQDRLVSETPLRKR